MATASDGRFNSTTTSTRFGAAAAGLPAPAPPSAQATPSAASKERPRFKDKSVAAGPAPSSGQFGLAGLSARLQERLAVGRLASFDLPSTGDLGIQLRAEQDRDVREPEPDEEDDD